jgi:hypothetical protein
MRYFIVISVILISYSFVPLVFAHTPLSPGEEIHSFDTAFEVPNPTKSWALYRELHHEGEAEFFKLHLHEEERLRVNVFVKEKLDDFSPHLAIASEAILDADLLPDFIEIPDSFGVRIVEAEMTENLEYEPFTPTSYYYLHDVDETISVEGDYYVIVFEPNSEEGKYGIAIGYKEEFTVSEWLLIPFDVIAIHQWEGQSLILIISPLLFSLIVGFVLIVWKKVVRLDFPSVLGVFSGLFYVGSGFMIFLQMFIALYGAIFDALAVLTVVFGFLPILFGFAILRKAARFKGKLSIRDRVELVLLGVGGFMTWAGLLVSPVLVLLIAILPNQVFYYGKKSIN